MHDDVILPIRSESWDMSKNARVGDDEAKGLAKMANDRQIVTKDGEGALWK